MATSGLQLRDLKNLICQRIQPLTRAAGAVVEMVEGEEIYYAAASGLLSPYVGLRLKRDASLSGLSVAESKVLYCEDAENDPRVDKIATRKLNVRSMICVPLIYHGTPVGVLKVVSPEPSFFTEREIQILTLVAGLLSSSIAQAKAMKMLHASENKFKAIFENASDGIVVYKNGVILEANAAACQIYGYSHDEIVGKHAYTMIREADVPRVLKNIAMDTNLPTEYEVFRKDGSVITVESRGKNVLIDGEVHRVARIIDVTEKKKIMDELRASEAKAREANEFKSRFLANMSHEVRTPLNGILGVIEILSDTSLDKDQKDYLQILKKSSQDLLRIVNDILDFSKISQNKVQLERIRFEPRTAFSEILSVMKHLSEKKHVSFYTRFDESVPEFIIGDPTRVKQILNNLLSNALKFTIQGEISFQVSQYDQRIRFEVRDTGIGISSQEEKNIFEAFKQGDTSTTRKFGGTGLGLSICKELVRIMDGSIGFSSSQGIGSTFWFELPLLQEESVLAENQIRTKKTSSALRVLLVEDNEVNSLITSKMLEKLGHQAVLVVNGAEALQKLQEQTFDVILMDCQMPVMDGFEATRQIRKGVHQPGIRIIAMTAHAMEGDREKCLSAGMDDYLSKPMKIADLRNVLELVTFTQAF